MCTDQSEPSQIDDLTGPKAYQITKCLEESRIKSRWVIIVIRSCNKVLQQVFFHFGPWLNHSLACSQQFVFSPLPKAYQILKCVSNKFRVIVQRKQGRIRMDMIIIKLSNGLLSVACVLSLLWFDHSQTARDVIQKSK